jgi:hypothetical protein
MAEGLAEAAWLLPATTTVVTKCGEQCFDVDSYDSLLSNQGGNQRVRCAHDGGCVSMAIMRQWDQDQRGFAVGLRP